MRCSAECSTDIYPVPAEIGPKAKGDQLTQAESDLLRWPRCGERSRPHVLLFDEYYNEDYYHYHRSLAMADQTGLLIIVGTSGSTNLPNQVARRVYQAGSLIIDINLEANPFSQVAEASEGYFLQYPSGTNLPELVKLLV